MRDIAVLDDVAMYAIGFDRVTVTAFRKILTAVQTTLPEVAAQAGETVVTLASLQLLVTALQLVITNIESDQAGVLQAESAARRGIAELWDAQPERNDAGMANVMRSLADMQADQQQAAVDINNLSRRLAELENGVN